MQTEEKNDRMKKLKVLALAVGGVIFIATVYAVIKNVSKNNNK